MNEKEIIIDKNKLWSYNENLYTEEFREKLREERRKANQEILDRIAREEEESKKQEQIIGSALRKYEAEARARDEVISPLIKQHLDAQIVVERWKLGLSMAMTFLFKGQWMLWIIFIILYNLKVERLKKEALEADLKRKGFGKRK